MIADEADQDGAKEFLVFAGVFFPGEKMLQIHNEVGSLRNKYGFVDSDVLKSATGTRPKKMLPADHAEIKNSILELAAATNCKICCYIIPHAIAKGQNHENRLKFGTNTLLIKFDQFLRESGKLGGIALFDHTTDYNQSHYLREVFEQGLPFPDGVRKRLENVVKIETTSVGHSHLNSVTDIVVGSFRFVVNEPDKDKVGAVLMKSLAKIMWGKADNAGDFHVRELGLCIRPKNVKLDDYKADITAFVKRIERYANLQ
ncbi:MAG: hypothetical protein ABJI96_05475 [Paracoccaceae bacterium]